MQYLALAFTSAVLLACSAPLASRESLDGDWTVEMAQTPLDPRVLTLVQHGTSITGTGHAMGVDAPIPITVEGSVTGSHVVLTFHFSSGDGSLGTYAATFDFSRRLSGVATFPQSGFPAHSVTYIRK